MTHVATNEQLKANYRNNGSKAEPMAWFAVQIANGVPDALNHLEKMPVSQRQNLAHALRELARNIDC